MIDINELRRLAQAATPGPWKILPVGDGGQKFAVADRKSLSILTVTDEGEATFGTVYDDADAKFIAAANPAAISELLDRLEAAERNLDCCRSERKEAAALFLSIKTRLTEERDALRAKIERMERQKPVTWQTRTRPAWNDGTWGPWRKCSEEYAEDIKKTPLLHDWLYEARALYTLPGAQQCKNCNGMGDRFDPSGEKIPCDLCESHLEEIRSLVAEAAHDIISGSDFWLSISLAAKKIYARPGAQTQGEKK